uniref:Uncharacterized protein n=1 Tax=Meloidogyne floridensis TaxID=298350 RepID=A0A915NJR4_9BILA
FFRGGLVFGSPDNNNNSDIEEPSPRYYSSYSPPPSHQYKQHPQHYQNNQMSTSTIIGGGGGSSDSTSGFASMIGGCENKNYSNRGGGGGTFLLEDSFHHSPQKQQQQQAGMFGGNNKGASFASSPPFRVKTTTDLPSHHQQQQQSSSQTRMKAIRMDIDLSSSGLGSGGSTPLEGNGGGGLTRNGRPSSFGNVFASGGGKGERGTTDKITATTTATTMAGDELSVRATVLRTAPPTAFTISFNDEHAQLGGQVSIAEVSLQEAARQAPKGRRLMLSRKNENFNKQKQQQPQDSGSECGGDPKRWLFRKMMMGRKGETTAAKSSGDRRRRRSGSAISEATTSTTMSGGGGGGNETTEEGQEDLASEAGTYVVENKIKTTGTINDVMTTSQISGVSNTSSNRTTQRCYDSDSDSSSSTHASTHTSSTGRTPSPGNPPISATTTNIRPPLTISGQVGKRSLMSDLRQLRESGQIEKPSIINQQSASNVKIANKKIPPKALGVLPTSTKLASTAPPIPPHRGNSAGVTTTTATNSNNNLKKNTTLFASNPIPFSRPCLKYKILVAEASRKRNDGGRFSMRPTSATRANTNALRQTAAKSHRSHDELNRLAEVYDDEDDSIGLTSDSCNVRGILFD